MKRTLTALLVIFVVGLAIVLYAFKEDTPRLRSGDVIFQTSMSRQCQAVRLATHSIFSHCGMIWIKDDKPYVLEAVQPVKITLLDEWIRHGEGKKYVVRRLKNADSILTPAVLQKMQAEGKKMLGKSYDGYFEWSDDQIYCSELVWKIYKRAAGIEVGKLQRIKDFDLSSEPVKQIIRERYGDKLPENEIVISPQSIYESSLFVTVRSKYD
ncbi:YiiX family permuted papain-like enzyme [Chitinophaga filiformis]|uniref:Permuted papain-like amidase enzyme, YaeF/YiiX, C92 family n=1 Tax=Chitinophaga filiformis TaxID=104663 RepID=A0A1G7H7A6_CHIFI|nr:YiiX family permuted papain-like enzyme [Chitinophaga filiformis]SDE96251.1 Permuted papain-like amidase enzyme, YaeF/YiiX, C92 family [Chitinophaga filiformis]